MSWKINNTFKRKVAEGLLIKKYKPSLNVQEKSVKLELFYLHSCVPVRVGTDGTPRMKRFTKMVNGLSRWLFSLRALSWDVGLVLAAPLRLRWSVLRGWFAAFGPGLFLLRAPS